MRLSYNRHFFNLRDHEFDDPGRLRVKPKAKEATIDPSRNAVARGALGVRWENARRNESKLLPTLRLGLDLSSLTSITQSEKPQTLSVFEMSNVLN